MSSVVPASAAVLSAAEVQTLRRLAQLLRRLPPETTIGSALAAGLINDARLGWALRPMGDLAAARRWLGLPEIGEPPEEADA